MSTPVRNIMIPNAVMVAVFAIFALFAYHTHADEVPYTLKLQILLDRAGFSCGEIDGIGGSNTQKALAAFERTHNLPEKRKPNADLWQALDQGQTDLLLNYQIVLDDVKGPFAPEIPEDMMEKMQLAALNYTSPLELLAEKFHASPDLLRRLNPKSKFQEGDHILVPNVADTGDAAPVRNARVIVSEKRSELFVQSPDGKTIFYAPATAGSIHEPLPLGMWKVRSIIPNPEFFYNPELFWDADATHSKGKIAPGPNSPVGIVWIDITAKHYGLHGTPEPSKIGHSESNGCVRLTNWDAMHVAALIKPGTEVTFDE